MIELQQLPPLSSERPHVRVLSLSAPVAAELPERYARSLQTLRELGFEVSEGKHALAHHHHMAGTVAERTEDFLEAWFDDEVEVILSVIGGHSTHQILPDLPYDKLALHPKVLVGYSDTTTLMLALLGRAGVPSFYGPALMPHFGEVGGPHPYTLSEFFAALACSGQERTIPPANCVVNEHLAWGTEDTRPRASSPSDGRRCHREGRAEGQLVVANMGCLLLLAGTPFFPDLKDTLLVLEEDESESPETIDRYFTQMKQMGIFSQIKGLVVGRFPASVNLNDDVLDEIIARSVGQVQIPILSGFEVGHVDPATTLPLGVRAELDAQLKTLTLLESPYALSPG